MMAQVLEMFAQGYEVVIESYYGDEVVKSAEEIHISCVICASSRPCTGCCINTECRTIQRSNHCKK